MKNDSTIERLKQIILQIGPKKDLAEKQILAILSLVDAVHSGRDLTDDYLIGIFDNVGGD
jgi:hypothetical protein